MFDTNYMSAVYVFTMPLYIADIRTTHRFNGYRDPLVQTDSDSFTLI